MYLLLKGAVLPRKWFCPMNNRAEASLMDEIDPSFSVGTHTDSHMEPYILYNHCSRILTKYHAFKLHSLDNHSHLT